MVKPIRGGKFALPRRAGEPKMPEIDAELTTSYAAFVRQAERPATAGLSDALRRVLLNQNARQLM